MNHTLDSVLAFAPGGKLIRLCLAGLPNLLHSGSAPVDLGGKWFQPVGWDECFPTIDPYGESAVMGELVGRVPATAQRGDCIEQVWQADSFEAGRSFSLTTPTRLNVSFRATNRSVAPLEFLWASHALFSTGSLREVHFPDGTQIVDFSIDRSEKKFFVANTGAVELSYPTFRAILTTNQPWWGIWLNRGGWPEKTPLPFVCLGVEATSAPSEHPSGTWLQPEEIFRGEVTLEVCF